MSLKCVAHVPVQHRDGKPPWCKNCGLDESFSEPESLFDSIATRKDRVENLRAHILSAMIGDTVYSEVEAHIMLNEFIKLSGGF